MLSRQTETVALVAALSVCLTTWWPLVSHHDAAMLITPLYLYTVLACLVGGLMMMPLDRWLGILIVLVSVRAIVLPTPQAVNVVAWLTVGAGLVLLVQNLSESGARFARRGLVVLAVAQTLYALPQLAKIDPLWIGFNWTREAQIHGTFENSRQLAGVLAMIAPLAPLWLAPLFALGVVACGSILGAVALMVGLGIALRHRWYVVLPGCVLGLVGAITLRGISGDSAWMRWTVLELAARDWSASWWTIVAGWGPGMWFVRVPGLQLAYIPEAVHDAYYAGHNDPAQFIYDYGLLALVPVLGWLWTHRAALLRPAALGSVAALGVFSLGMSPFHFPTSGTLGALVLGLAARR